MTTKHAPPRRRVRHTLSLLGLTAALLGSAGAASAAPSTLLYVSPTGSDTNPGTQASPFLTIQAAINASNGGGTIDIADGIYTGPGNVDLSTNGTSLTIQSDHGAASTIIDCGGGSSVDHRGFSIHSGETVSITGLTIRNGYESSDSGGGFNIVNSNVTLTGCIISGNTVSNYGGAIYNLCDYGNGNLTLTNCRLSGNAATLGGGVFSRSESYTTTQLTTTLTNCTLTANTANSGGGLYSQSNDDPVTGSNDTTTLTNCIVYGDTAGQEIVAYNYYSSSNVIVAANNCDINGGVPTGVLDSGGNIDADPLFVSATDFHLLPGSPALGTGDSTSAPATDLDGTTRPNPPSMGAYEVGTAPATLTSIAITFASVLTVGATDQLTATATYSDGTTADVTSQVQWTTDDPAKATVDASGLATAVGAGPINITATYVNPNTGTVTGTVNVSIAAGSVTPTTPADYILWNNGDGRASVWNMSDPNPVASCHIYGPYPGWTAKTIAEGADGHARLLWTNTDGRVSLWNLADSDPVAGCHIYGPFAGWTAKTLAIGSDNTPRILWSKTDGQMSLWSVDSTGGFTYQYYGPFPHWTAKTMAVGSDNHPHILWDNTNGANSLWDVDTTGAFTYHYAGPFAGWSAKALSVGANNATHLLWRNTNGLNSVWNVNFSATSFAFSFNLYGPYGGWTPAALADGQDGQTRVLWNNVNGQVSLWSLNSTTAAFMYHYYGPYAGWTATSVAAH